MKEVIEERFEREIKQATGKQEEDPGGGTPENHLEKPPKCT